MDPLTILKAVPWKLVGIVAAGIFVALLVLMVLHWRTDSIERLPAAREALQREIDCAEASHCAKKVAAMQAAHRALNDQAARDYETRIAEIAARPVPTQPVRLCRPANNRVRVPGAAPAVSPGQGAELPTEIGRDIAVELFQLADDADREALKLELLYGRDVALASPPK